MLDYQIELSRDFPRGFHSPKSQIVMVCIRSHEAELRDDLDVHEGEIVEVLDPLSTRDSHIRVLVTHHNERVWLGARVCSPSINAFV
jgi:hypothetical protein